MAVFARRCGSSFGTAALNHHDLTFDFVITSEDVRSYKPRPELFIAGLDAIGTHPDGVLHVGDSLTNDVAGGQRLGIATGWTNRSHRPAQPETQPTYEFHDLRDIMQLTQLSDRT